MSSRFLPPIVLIVLLLSTQTAFSQIWLENFSGGNQGWTDNFTDCDGGGSNGVNAGRYEVVDMEGSLSG